MKLTVNNLFFDVQGSWLLSDVSCEFESGQIHCIVGQNGAGKSTLLNCLTKACQPSKGDISWGRKGLNDIDISSLAQQRAVLSQATELAFSFRVEQLVELGAEVQQDARNMDAIVNTVLQVCDIDDLRQRDYLTLSGGEQKRVHLARVLAQIWPRELSLSNLLEGESSKLMTDDTFPDNAPFANKWLFLDEWTAGLDVKHQQKLTQYFKQCAQWGLGIVMVVHDIGFTAQVADRVLLLKDGRVFSEGSVREVLTARILRDALGMQATVKYEENQHRPQIYPWLDIV